MGSPRVYFPGVRLGFRELVRQLTVGRNARWLARCLVCGKDEELIAGTAAWHVRQGYANRCRSCANDARRLVSFCTTCGQCDPAKFPKGRGARTCMACHRAAARYGRCPCGCAIRKRGPRPLFCLCDTIATA